MDVVRIGWPVSNVWLLPSTDLGPVLVDTGIDLMWPQLLLGLRLRGLRPGDLGAVILTHHHTDHAGNAARLQRLGVPIYAHSLDAAVLSGRSCQPVIQLPGRRVPPRLERSITSGMCLINNNHPAPRCEVHALEHGDRVAGLDVHWVPGHTTGSVFLFHTPSGALFSGDGLLNSVPPMAQRRALTLPYPTFCEDHALALRSLAEFVDLGLPVRSLYAGHGRARHGGILSGAAALLQRC